MACALASLFGRKCFRTGFSAFPPALLAAFSAHLAHDFGYLLGVYSLIHLYEALYLVNHGIEEAVRGVPPKRLRHEQEGFVPMLRPLSRRRCRENWDPLPRSASDEDSPVLPKPRPT